MKALVPLAFALVAVLAGCLSDGDGEEPSLAGECVPPATCGGGGEAFEARLQSCVLAAFTVELRSEVYALPDGFASSPSATSPQRVPVVAGTCGSVEVMGQVEQGVSFGHAAILVEAPDRGQATDFDLFDLEMYSDSQALRALLERAGLPVVDASIAVTDSGGLRQVEVSGGARYDMTAEFIPAPGASNDVSEAHHSESGWVRIGRSCQYYEGTAPAQVLAGQGRLTEAAAAGPLLGRGSQTVSCDLTVRVAAS